MGPFLTHYGAIYPPCSRGGMVCAGARARVNRGYSCSLLKLLKQKVESTEMY